MATKKQRSPRDWREGRRLRALELHAQGWTGTAIAAALGVSQSAVSQWLKRGREGGPDALRAQPPPGRVPRLSAEQRGALPHLLARGAEAFGFLGEVWTSKRIARVIRRNSGCTTIPTTWGACSAPLGGVRRSRSAARPNAMKRRLSAGP